MRRAFTMIELLVIVAILSTMVIVGTVSIISAQQAYSLKAMTRDVMAAIRHARSLALASQQQCAIIYSTKVNDGEVFSKIVFKPPELIVSDSGEKEVYLLTENKLISLDDPESEIEKTSPLIDNSKISGSDFAGESSIEGGSVAKDLLSQEIEFQGVALKVLKGNELLDSLEFDIDRERSPISVFSNVDRLRLKQSSVNEPKSEEVPKTGSNADSVASYDVEAQEPVTIMWEANGCVGEEHRVYVYQPGTRPEDGYCVEVDRFGSVKVLSEQEDD